MLRFLMLGVLLVGPTVQAMTVSNFEALLEQQLHRQAEQRSAATLALTSYFSGVTDTLNGARGQSGELYYAGPKKICLPSGVFLTGPVLLEQTKLQVRQVDASGSLKKDWKSSNLSMFVFFALVSNYPCK